MRTVHLALSRALSFLCGTPAFDGERFLHRVVWELGHLVGSEFSAIALVVKRRDGSCFIGRSREHQALPAETLLGLLVEGQGERLTCRVRDHALDTVRFIDNRFRTSIIARLEMPSGVIDASEAALWFGLSGGASSESVAEAEGIARDVGEWLTWYSPVIEATIKSASECQVAQRRVSEMTALAHDARAPLGVLKYLLRGALDGSDTVSMVERELEYLERILAQGAPVSRKREETVIDVGEVVSRVYRRFEAELGRERLGIDRCYQALFVDISDLDLERVMTNLVSNAQRHGPGCRIILVVEELEDCVLLKVRDNGPGMSESTIAKALAGDGAPIESESGWGVGLQSSVAKVKAYGGEVEILSEVGVGTEVRIRLPRCRPPASELFVMHTSDRVPVYSSAPRNIDVFIVDDDEEHAQSLARLVRSVGFSVQVAGGVDDVVGSSSLSKDSLILCDGRMPDGGAERLLKVLSARVDAPRVAVVSGDNSEEFLYRLAALGAKEFFPKPVNHRELVDWIRAELVQRGSSSHAA